MIRAVVLFKQLNPQMPYALCQPLALGWRVCSLISKEGTEVSLLGAYAFVTSPIVNMSRLFPALL